jgi:methionine-rich copper-binding protein CopC/phosphohistidine phosphatase SixA
VRDSGQVIVFTPSAPWLNGALVQVFLDGTAQDVDGNSLSSYQGSFRTAVDTTTITPSVVSASPSGGSNVPTNVVIDVGFNETLNSATVNSTTVSLVEDVCCNFPVIPSTLSLLNGGTVVQITPSAPLLANTFYFVQINSGLQGTNGLAFPFTEDAVFFETGAGTDTVVPTIVSVSPPNGSVNVGDNAQIRVVFSKPVNPLTVNSGSIQLTGGGTTAVADSISFGNNNQSVVLVPHAPMPDNTVMTLTIGGVTDIAGNPAATQSTTFTTGTGPDVIAPSVVNENPFNGASNVPVNTPIMLQVSEPIDPGTVNSNTLFIEDEFTGQEIAGNYSVSTDGRTINFLPSVPLPVSRTFFVFFANEGITDLSGNLLSCAVLCNYQFITGTTANTTGPSVVGVSPANGLTGVPINAQVVVQFSEPVDDLTLNQITLSGGGGPVSVISRLSNANQTLTLLPVVPLSPSTTYTVNVSGVRDLSGNVLTVPVTTSFTTGAGADLTPPTVTTVSPVNGATGVPTNGVIQVQFSKRVDPLTVNTADFIVFPQATDIPIPGTIAVSANGLTATFTPNPPLDPSTGYFIEATSGIVDLQGLALQGTFTGFTTGLGAATTAPVVVQVSPANGTLGVPVNPQVVVVVNAAVSAASVGSSAITVAAGGTPVNGSISLSSDRTTLAFVPSNLLTVSTAYVVTVSGFSDQAGNLVTPFSSTFSTGTSGVADITRPAVTAVSPANGATGVSAGSSIVLTFNEVIDAATVNANTVQIEANGFSGQLAGSYAVDTTGKIVTFTPVSPLPGNTLIFVVVNGVTDLSGNGNNFFESTFTTGAGTDTTAPTVLMVTPGNGATGIGLNATAVLTFSKSLNRNTVNGNTVGLLVNGSKLGVGISVSADNRVVVLNTGTLPASSTVTVVATTGVTDISGNALSNFESSFSTASAFDTTHPAVVVQRPGNGATGVPVNSSVVLYVNEAMNAGTVQGALHVSQNGVLASGTTQVRDNGQVIVFTPSAPWLNNALIQVFLDSTAQDLDGSTLNSYQGSFRTAVDTTTITPSVVSVSPNGGSSVPTNVVIDVGFNETLNAATVNSTTVSLVEDVCCNFPVIPSTVSLLNGGTVVQITPSAPLLANTFYFVQINSGLQGTNGLAFPFTEDVVFFETGTGADTVVPTIVSVSPPNGSVNVGDNAQIRVVFSKPVNPLTVNSGSIQLTGGGTTAVADSISFSNNNQSVVLVPHAPMPDNTVMTLTIAGVTDVAGNVAATQSTTFTTGTGPDVIAPSVVNENPFNGASNVPVNTPIMLQASEPIDPGTVNSNTLFIEDDTTGQEIAGGYSVSTDGRAINFLPNTPLAVSRTFSVFFANEGITDLSGNLLSCAVLCNYSFTTGTTTDAAGPSVVGVSPANGLTGVQINAQVVVQFSEPVDDLTLNQITLSGGGGPVSVISRLSNANQTLTLLPVVPLSPGTTYTVNVSGVQDLSGNPLTASSTTTFTTGTGADLTPPTVTTVSPVNGATAVLTTAVIQVQFSKRVDPLTVNTADFIVFPQATDIPIPGAIAVSADGLTATFTPSSPLNPSTGYFIEVTGNVLDLEGLTLQGTFTGFTTGTQ